MGDSSLTAKKSADTFVSGLFRVQFVLKISSSYVVRANGEYFFCFPLNDPLGKNSCPVTRAGQANGAAFSVFA